MTDSTPRSGSPPGSGLGYRRLHHVVRNALYLAAVILLGLGLDLTLFPRDTDRFFSWTIDVSLTAGTLGAFYLSAFVIVLLTLTRGLTWARARVVLGGGIAFSSLAILATAIHADKFHFNRSGIPLIVAWVWTIAYAVLLPVILVGLIPQRRLPGIDPPKVFPPSWLAVALGGFGLVLFVVGVFLFVAPQTVAKDWPWPLTALTGRVLGAWAVGLGLVFLVAARQGDRFRMLPSTVGLGLFGLLQLLTVWRFSEDMAWSETGAWVYVVFLGAALVAGTAGSLALTATGREARVAASRT